MTLPIQDLLQITVDADASDLHITTYVPPRIRVHGVLKSIDHPSLTPADTKQLVYSLLTDKQKKQFEEKLELDFSFGLQGPRPFPGQRLHAEGRGGRGHPPLPAQHVELPEAGHPGPRGPALLPSPRPHPRHRAHRLRQIDDPGLHDRPHQRRAGRPRRHRRGPHRILLHPQEGPDQPARALRRHAVLLERAALRPARRPRRRPGRGDARPGNRGDDHPGRRDGPSDLFHPAHEFGLGDDLPHHRHLPARSTSPRPGSCCPCPWRPS